MTKEHDLKVCYATIAYTESGDSCCVLLWPEKPDNGQVTAAYKKLYPEEYNEEEDFNTLHWHFEKVKWGDGGH